jgi:hypothetical protein
MLDWFLIITNVPNDILDIKAIGECYRIFIKYLKKPTKISLKFFH